MAFTASTPDAFYDREVWAFTLELSQDGTDQPFDLTGSRLVVVFKDEFGRTVASCDSDAPDGQIMLTDPVNGVVDFAIHSVGRKWRVASCCDGTGQATVTGDLYRYPPGEEEPEALLTFSLDIVASTGLPA